MRSRACAALCALAISGCLDADIRRGDEALGAGRYQAAITFYELARERLEPGDELPTQRIASAHRVLAVAYASKGSCAKGREHLALAEAHTEAVLVDHQLLVECETSQPDTPPSVRIAGLRRLLELGDHRARTTRALMHLELESGHETAAVALIEALEKRFALTVPDRRKLSATLIRLGKQDAAREQLEKALRVEPNSPLLRLKLAELLEARGTPAAARPHYERLVHEYPGNRLVRLRLAQFYGRCECVDPATLAEAQRAARQGAATIPPRALRPLRRSKD